MFAVLPHGGKQYLVHEGQTLRLEKINDAEVGATLTLAPLLCVIDDNGTTTIGMPHIEKATITATVLNHGRAKKVMVGKFKAKVRYRRTHGHRQHFTELRIDKVHLS